MVNIVITDDHPMMLEGLKNILAAEPDFKILDCFTDGKSTLDQIKHIQPDILLLDINLPDTNSIELVALFKKRCPQMKIVAISVHNEYAVINSMITEGADGYIQKNASGAEIIAGIRSVYQGELFLCVKTKLKMSMKDDIGLQNVPKLTRREKEILMEAIKGSTTVQIAETLFISHHTVESHRKNLIEKFEVKSIASVIKLALEYGILRD
ncbi:MAG: response regulator transcription factor [Chryseobacterium sp.]|nr:MAG: response regulator transcription factor [Chryseobacterium sp.]